MNSQKSIRSEAAAMSSGSDLSVVDVHSENDSCASSNTNESRLHVDSDVSAMFDLIDDDKDGAITLDDMYGFVSLFPATIDAAASTADTNEPKTAMTNRQQSVSKLRSRFEEDEKVRSFVSAFFRLCVFVKRAALKNHKVNTDAACTQKETDSDDCLLLSLESSAKVDSDHHREDDRVITLNTFKLLHKEVNNILDSTTKSFLFVLLDMTFLHQTSHFFTCVAEKCKRYRGGSAPKKSLSGLLKKTSFFKKESKSTSPSSPQKASHGGSVVSAMMWMSVAWEERRSLFDVHMLQRFGETFLEFKAKKQERQMRQFLRLYRYLFSKQTHRGNPMKLRREKDDGSVHDFGVRSLLLPDPLSMLPSLSVAERKKVQQMRGWAMVRACLYGLGAALVIGLAELSAAQYFLGSQETLSDSSLTSTKIALSWGAELLFLSGLSDPPISNTTNATFPPSSNTTVTAASDTTVSPLWQYRIAVSVVSIVVSLVEVILLYTDNLRVSFAMAKTAGIPLHHHVNRRSEYFLRRKENEVLTIKESLTRKRVRFVISAISRCALELSSTTVSILGVDVTPRHTSVVCTAMYSLILKLRKSVSAFLLRIVVSRVLSKFMLPFIATPVLIAWNYFVSKNATRRSRGVVLGAVSCELLTRELLQKSFKTTPQLVFPHHGSSQEKKISPGSSLASQFFHVPFHVYREAVCVVGLLCHLSGSVHPSIHLILVTLASHAVSPDTTTGREGDTILSTFVRDLCRNMSDFEKTLNGMSNEELQESFPNLSSITAEVRTTALLDVVLPGWIANGSDCLFNARDVHFLVTLAMLSVIVQGKQRSTKCQRVLLSLRNRWSTFHSQKSMIMNEHLRKQMFLQAVAKLGDIFADGVPLSVSRLQQVLVDN